MSAWKPIETAPRDGTEILLDTERGRFVASFETFECGTSVWMVATTHGGTSALFVPPGWIKRWHQMPEST